jgi:hypothetical protein
MVCLIVIESSWMIESNRIGRWAITVRQVLLFHPLNRCSVRLSGHCAVCFAITGVQEELTSWLGPKIEDLGGYSRIDMWLLGASCPVDAWLALLRKDA